MLSQVPHVTLLEKSHIRKAGNKSKKEGATNVLTVLSIFIIDYSLLTWQWSTCTMAPHRVSLIPAKLSPLKSQGLMLKKWEKDWIFSIFTY